MPAYDYRCPACDTVFEVKRRFSDRSEVRCPRCDAVAKRVFTPVGVHFKGSGFYNTDYKHCGAGAPVSKETSTSESATASKEPAAGAGSSNASECGGCAACSAASNAS